MFKTFKKRLNIKKFTTVGYIFFTSIKPWELKTPKNKKYSKKYTILLLCLENSHSINKYSFSKKFELIFFLNRIMFSLQSKKATVTVYAFIWVKVWVLLTKKS